MLWKAGMYGDVSLSDGVIEYAKTHEELKGAFLTFQKDADQIYPGWKEKLGYTGESSVQAASFDWQKKAAAAGFVGVEPASSSRGALVQRQVAYDAPAWNYENNKKKVYPGLAYVNDIGYFPDGTAMHSAGNAQNHPERMGPDLHQTGAALPLAKFVNDVGYLPDGTPKRTAESPDNQRPTLGGDPTVVHVPPNSVTG